MRPWLTIVLVVIAVAALAYFHLRPQPSHPRETDFVNCYVELSLLAARSDTVGRVFYRERDSILTAFNFTDSSLLQVKSELNLEPERLVVIWDMIEARVKERRVELGLKPLETKE